MVADDVQPKVAVAVRDAAALIDQHRQYLRDHEFRTRILLIDKVVDALGWGVLDPNQVQLEAFSKSGRPDYTLWCDGSPVAVIEAKSLGTNLNQVKSEQLMNYADLQDGGRVGTVALTNGDRWRILYQNEETGRWASVSARATGDAWEAAYKLTKRLSRSVLKPRVGKPELPNVGTVEVPLGQLEYTRKTKLRGLVTPDGGTVKIGSYAALYLQVARHLVVSSKLDAGLIPFGFDSGKRYSVANRPFHGDGKGGYDEAKPFDRPRDLSPAGNNDGPWLEAFTRSGPSTPKFTKLLIKKCGGDPSQFKITKDA